MTSNDFMLHFMGELPGLGDVWIDTSLGTAAGEVLDRRITRKTMIAITANRKATPPQAAPTAVATELSSAFEGGGEGDGGGGRRRREEGDHGGGGGQDSAALMMVGSASTEISSAADAAAAVPRLEESLVCTASVDEAGTLIVAVMITLPAATLMDTDERSTPATVATERLSSWILMAEQSPTLPLALRVSTTVSVESSTGPPLPSVTVTLTFCDEQWPGTAQMK